MSKKRNIDFYKGLDADYQKLQAFKMDRNKFNSEGIYEANNSIYDYEGYDKDGYNKNGFNRAGLHRLTGKHYDENGLDAKNKKVADKKLPKELTPEVLATLLSEGEITTLEFIKVSDKTLDELVTYAKDTKMSPKVIRDLYAKKKEYQVYTKPFDKEEYLKFSKVKKGDEIISPTEENVNDCLKYMNENDMYVCDRTARDMITSYIKGEIDFSKSPEENRSREAILKDKQRALAEAKAKLNMSEKQKTAANALVKDYKVKQDEGR